MFKNWPVKKGGGGNSLFSLEQIGHILEQDVQK